VEWNDPQNGKTVVPGLERRAQAHSLPGVGASFRRVSRAALRHRRSLALNQFMAVSGRRPAAALTVKEAEYSLALWRREEGVKAFPLAPRGRAPRRSGFGQAVNYSSLVFIRLLEISRSLISSSTSPRPRLAWSSPGKIGADELIVRPQAARPVVPGHNLPTVLRAPPSARQWWNNLFLRARAFGCG